MHPTIGTEMVGGAHPTIAHHAERDGYTPRKPLARLDEISSPYLAGILDAAEERMLLLETLRGCVFKCKFCYYPKSYDDLYFLGREKIEANLRHARERGADEVVLLDPTLNQRRDFPEFLKLLADCNPTVPSKNPPGPPLRKGGTEKGAARNGDDRAFTYFGELRAEGITDETARLLREANFTEVEVGLQSIDPRVQELMDRKNNLRAFERGVRAMTEQGIRVKVDLIIGLPGDTVESVRRGIAYVRDNGLYTQVQVFNLAVLPGTAFRQEAAALGLEFQPIPPYYVLRTPTLALPDLHDLMREAQEAFDTEFDPLPPPQIHFPANGNGDGTPHGRPVREWFVDLDVPPSSRARRPAAADRAGAFSLWLRSDDFSRTASDAAAIIVELLRDNPHSTLQIVLESTASPHAITPRVLETLRAACYESTSYLDRFYSISPGRPKGAKRLIVLLPYSSRRTLGDAWIDAICDYAEIVWRGGPATSADDLAEHEYCLAAASAVAY
ncbi:MAG: radical SAM protein [Planctomycetia bacterium]|nr:radical SAM protein [Planctomycetia bacterium]